MSTTRAGQYRHRLRYEEPAPTSDSHNQDVPTWPTVIPLLWAEVRTPTGREAFVAQTMQAQATHVIELRYQWTTPVKPTGRLVDLDALPGSPGIYNLSAVTDPDGRRRTLVCYAVEALNPNTDTSTL